MNYYHCLIIQKLYKMNEIYYNLKNNSICPKDLKFDYFHFFKEKLEPNTKEKIYLSHFLNLYPINSREKENYMIEIIEEFIDKIYLELTKN
jgi:hypothetical protein